MVYTNSRRGGKGRHLQQHSIDCFGNGYIQTASSGINTKRRTVPIVYGGSDWEEVYNFCQDHVTKPFVWKAPDGRMGVFVVTADSVNLAPQGGGVFEVTAEFAERFTSAG